MSSGDSKKKKKVRKIRKETGEMGKDTGLGAGFSTHHLLEGLVNGPKPADVGAGCEEDEPEKGEAKVGGSPASDQPRETAHQVHGQRDAIHCRPGSTSTDTRQTADTHTHTKAHVEIHKHPYTDIYPHNSTQTHNQRQANSRSTEGYRHTQTHMQTTFIQMHTHKSHQPTHTQRYIRCTYNIHTEGVQTVRKIIGSSDQPPNTHTPVPGDLRTPENKDSPPIRSSESQPSKSC